MPSAVAELVERLVEAGQEPHDLLSLSPEEALDAGLSHVNAMAMTGYSQDQLLHVLRSPSSIMDGEDHALKQLLCAFVGETDETLLIQIAGGEEIGWAELVKAAHVALPLGHSRRSWIVARDTMSCVARP